MNKKKIFIVVLLALILLLVILSSLNIGLSKKLSIVNSIKVSELKNNILIGNISLENRFFLPRSIELPELWVCSEPGNFIVGKIVYNSSKSEQIGLVDMPSYSAKQLGIYLSQPVYPRPVIENFRSFNTTPEITSLKIIQAGEWPEHCKAEDKSRIWLIKVVS